MASAVDRACASAVAEKSTAVTCQPRAASQSLHAELAVDRERGCEQLVRPLSIVRAVTGNEHPRMVAQAVGEPGAGADPLVHSVRDLEVGFCRLPAPERRAEEAEVAGDRSARPFRVVGGGEVGPRHEQAVQHFGGGLVREQCGRLREGARRVEPLLVER